MRAIFPTLLCIAFMLCAPGEAAMEIDADFVHALLGKTLGGVREKPPVIIRRPSHLDHLYVHLLGSNGNLLRALPKNIRNLQVVNAAGQLVSDISRSVHFMKLLDSSPDDPDTQYLQIIDSFDPILKRVSIDPEEPHFKFELRRMDTGNGPLGVNWDIVRFGDADSEEISFIDLHQKQNIKYLRIISQRGDARFKVVQSGGRTKILPITRDVPNVKYMTITVQN